MSSSILHPPAHLSPAIALQLAQNAPEILSKTPSSLVSFLIQTPLSQHESAELWTIHENLLLSCLRTGDEHSAHRALQKLEERFGQENEKIMALHGLFKEATAKDPAMLSRVLQEYDAILQENPSNMPIMKRRVALYKSMGRVPEAITTLTELLESSPTDAESWAELGDLYASQTLYQQAIFAFEEVLLIIPNAWNIHARLAEVLYAAASIKTLNSNESERHLLDSLRMFCRSVELCDDFLRGYYGMKLASARLLTTYEDSRSSVQDSSLDIKRLQRLNEVATAKLSEIVRRSVARENKWEGYNESELIAARDLLSRDASNTGPR